MDFYRRRIADELLKKALECHGAVQIRGPRACGKTTTAMQIGPRRVIDLQDDEKAVFYRNMIDASPYELLDGPKPILLDEWQVIPKTWNLVSHAVKSSGNKPGSYILTGSASLNVVPDADSAIDQIWYINMWTMSLYESGESTGKVSLHEIIENPSCFDVDYKSNITKDDTLFLICRGGWPGCLVNDDKEGQLRYARKMMSQILNTNLHLRSGVRQNPGITSALLASYAKNNCKQTKSDKIYQDVKSVESDRAVIDEYIEALKSLYIIEDIDRWSVFYDSKESRSLPKHILTDPSIATSALKENPSTLKSERNKYLRGFLFECLCIRDIKVYASAFDSYVGYSFYRDEDSDEVDIVLTTINGNIALMECKFADRDVDSAVRNLKELERKIYRKMDEREDFKGIDREILYPHFVKIVLTASGKTEIRDGDVFIVPIGCLGP